MPPCELPEVRLDNECFQLTIVPAFGCHWTRLRISLGGDWRDFLVPVPDHGTLLREPTGTGSYVLAPWSNRIAGPHFTFRGRRYDLRPNFPDGTAIHGDVRTLPWTVQRKESTRFVAKLDAREFRDFNYPFDFIYRMDIELDRAALRVHFEIENVDPRPAPAGFGFHPFLKRRLTPKDDDVRLVVPANRFYPAAGCIPLGPAQSVHGRVDLRNPWLEPLGSPDLDDCFTDLIPNAPIRFVYPGSEMEVQLRCGKTFKHVVVYAPNDAFGPTDFVAVEPVTNANDGFNLFARGVEGSGVKVLEPQEVWGDTWEIVILDPAARLGRC